MQIRNKKVKLTAEIRNRGTLEFRRDAERENKTLPLPVTALQQPTIAVRTHYQRDHQVFQFFVESAEENKKVSWAVS